MEKEKSPWWIWLSVVGLILLILVVQIKEAQLARMRWIEKRKRSSEELEQQLGFGLRLSFMLGLFMLSAILIQSFQNLTPESWTIMEQITVYLHLYLSFVVITDCLYRFYFGNHKK